VLASRSLIDALSETVKALLFAEETQLKLPLVLPADMLDAGLRCSL
jgi:hypothetical protein